MFHHRFLFCCTDGSLRRGDASCGTTSQMRLRTAARSGSGGIGTCAALLRVLDVLWVVGGKESGWEDEKKTI